MEKTHATGIMQVLSMGCRKPRIRKKALICFMIMFLLAGTTGIGIQTAQAETGNGIQPDYDFLCR